MKQAKPLKNPISETERTVLAQVPFDVLVNIFIYLSAAEVCQLGATCKHLYELCNNDTLWKTYCARIIAPSFLKVKEEELSKQKNPRNFWKSQYVKLRTGLLCSGEFNPFSYQKKTLSKDFPQEFRLVILGAEGVGKTALTIQFIQHHFIDEYDPTIEDSYRKRLTLGNKALLYDILDTAIGPENVMKESYLQSCYTCIVVFSLTDHKTFEEVPGIIENIYQIKQSDYFPIVLVGNKLDLCDPKKPIGIKFEDGFYGLESDFNERRVASEEAIHLAKKYQCPYYETSAKTRENVQEAFFEISFLYSYCISVPQDPQPSKRKCSIQ